MSEFHELKHQKAELQESGNNTPKNHWCPFRCAGWQQKCLPMASLEHFQFYW